MLRKIGFAIHCSGHFIQEYIHEIETDEGKKSKRGFMVEADIPGEVFQTLEEAEEWCKARPQMQKRRKYGTGFRS